MIQNRFAERLLEAPDRAGNVSISSATVLRDFYLVQEEDGTWSDRIEDGFLGKIESNAAIRFKMILDERE